MAPTPPGILACLRSAIDILREEPVGVLLPAGGALLVELGTVIAARSAWDRPAPAALLTLALCLAARIVGTAAFRSRMIAVGARTAGLPAERWGRPLALVGLQILETPLVAAGAALIGVPLAALALVIAGHGWITSAAAVLTFGLAGATAVALALRALFAFAPAEVVIAGRSAPAALYRSAARTAGNLDVLPLIVLVGTGDLLVGLGAVLCGAGTLPGYPISDLAAIHRWRHPGAP